MKKICTVLMVQLLVLTAVHAQKKTPTKWAVGIWGGPTVMFGDFHNAGETVNGWNMGFLGQKALSQTLSLRFDVGYAQYKDIEDLVRKGGKVNYTWYATAYRDKNFVLNYKTYMYYGDFIAQVNLPLHSMLGKEKVNFNVYGMAGIGLNLSQVRGNRNIDGVGPKYDTQGADGLGGFDAYVAENGREISRDAAKAIFDDSWADYLLTNAEVNDPLLDKWKTNIEFLLGAGANYRLSDSWEVFGEARWAIASGEDNFDGVRATSNGTITGNVDVLFEGRVGVKFRFGKKNAVDWFDNMAAQHYRQTQDLADRMDGIYSDSDGDGVPDYLDKEPETPAGAAVDGSGRAMDADYDGIPDYADDDLFTPKGIAVDEKGSGVDSDGDGVADGIDKEPNTPKGALVNYQGVSINDAVGSGGSALPWIFFDRGSAEVSAQRHASQLSYIVSFMRSNPEAKIKITGHADYVGTEQFNYDLGLQRAQAVKVPLVKAGIDADRIIVDSKGESEFISEGGDKFADTMNRRAEITIVED